MDRLRKRFQELRSKVRKLFYQNWHNDPEGDVFRSLDGVFILGAVRYKPTQRWQHICWNTYCITTVCSFLLLVLNLLDEIPGKFDLVKTTWHATAVSASALCFVKNSILNQRFESIQAAQRFVNSRPFGSGNVQNDAAYRKKFFQRLQLMILVTFAVLLTNQIIFTVPNSGVNELFGTPRILSSLGPTFAGGIHFLFVFTICPIWPNKYLAGTSTVCSLLYGLKVEYDIFVRGFGNILDQVYLDVEEEISNTSKAAPDWKRYQRDQLFWKYLEQHVDDQLKLHIQLVENLQMIRYIVNDLFAIVYYNAMVTISSLIYVVWFNGLSGVSVFLASGITFFLLECYGWCSIIDSFNDVNEALEGEIMNLITKIPHSKVHHKEYIEMRSMLCIMKLFVRNNQPFSCGGVFTITVEAFTNLLDIGYSVLTFLMDVGKNV